MWFKYFNRSTWKIRMFRARNLKFDNNNIGYFRHHWSSKLKTALYKTIGNEGGIRAYTFFILYPLIATLSYVKSCVFPSNAEELAKQVEKEEQEKMLKELNEDFYKNR